MMPGKIVSPERSLAIRLSRSSSLTLRVRSLCSENSLFRSSPRVRGRFMKGPLHRIIRFAKSLPVERKELAGSGGIRQLNQPSTGSAALRLALLEHDIHHEFL